MLIGILSVAALFALFVLVKPRAGCGGNCGMCAKACNSSERNHG